MLRLLFPVVAASCTGLYSTNQCCFEQEFQNWLTRYVPQEVWSNFNQYKFMSRRAVRDDESYVLNGRLHRRMTFECYYSNPVSDIELQFRQSLSSSMECVTPTYVDIQPADLTEHDWHYHAENPRWERFRRNQQVSDITAKPHDVRGYCEVLFGEHGDFEALLQRSSGDMEEVFDLRWRIDTRDARLEVARILRDPSRVRTAERAKLPDPESKRPRRSIHTPMDSLVFYVSV